MSDAPKDEAKQAGGYARAKALTKADRSAIARRAALARFGKDLPRAVAEGVLQIGNVKLACAVLDDKENTRVFSQEGFLTAIGRAGKAKGGEGASVDGKPAFLRAQNLEPFISSDLVGSTTPVEFIPWKGPGYQGRAFGYKASLLPGVCWVYQDAMVAGKLTAKQQHIGVACQSLLKALTNYAIEDLVDRATGFDDIRKRDAIFRILEKCVSPEKLTWVKMFDTDFYRQVFRLNKWAFDPEKTARPAVLGHWTNNIYDRLAPGVKPVLHARVKRNASGRPTEKMTQYLTAEDGKPRLKEMLEGVKAIMRLSKDKSDFWEKMDVAYPKHPKVNVDELILPFDDLPMLAKPKKEAAG
ncbi:MAG TPA: P63C domain-containing protein [Pseudolabrys sp.]|nr:P63C domain-containing protein [Pseudolabrys sp.]